MRIGVVFPRTYRRRLPLEHEVYLCFLRGPAIECPDQVWSIDTTYIQLEDGFVCPTAIGD